MRYSWGANKLSGWRVLKERVWGDEAAGGRQSCRKQRPHHHHQQLTHWLARQPRAESHVILLRRLLTIVVMVMHDVLRRLCSPYTIHAHHAPQKHTLHISLHHASRHPSPPPPFLSLSSKNHAGNAPSASFHITADQHTSTRPSIRSRQTRYRKRASDNNSAAISFRFWHS